jgi:hypothetical protein
MAPISQDAFGQQTQAQRQSCQVSSGGHGQFDDSSWAMIENEAFTSRIQVFTEKVAKLTLPLSKIEFHPFGCHFSFPLNIEIDFGLFLINLFWFKT